MSKKKIATFWLAGCSGCHMSLLDIDERILDVAKLADIVKSPIVDGKELPHVDVALIEGAVASEEHFHELQNIRKKAKHLVSFGDCAVTGNVPSMRNHITKEAAIKCAYFETASTQNEKGIIPHKVISPLRDRVVPLHEVVPVDFVIPGCPPSADLIFYVLFELLNDRIPELDKGRLKYG